MKLIILFIGLVASQTIDKSRINREQDKSCAKCFDADVNNFFCMLGEDMYQGFCCDSELDAFTQCKKMESQFCSNYTPEKEGTIDLNLMIYRKYAWCPNDFKKCGS